MSLVKTLLARAGLIVLEAPSPPAEPGTTGPKTRRLVQRRSVTLAELLAESEAGRAARANDLRNAAAGLTADFDAIYGAAGVAAPPHGWTIDKAVEFARAPERVEKGAAEQRRALQAQLAIEKVPPEDLVRDATARDAAVDAYETFLKARVAELTTDLDAERARLEQERAALDARLAAVAKERAAARASFDDWCREKRAKERGWAEALTLLAADEGLKQTWISISAELPEGQKAKD